MATQLKKIQIRYYPPGLNLLYATPREPNLQEKELSLCGFDATSDSEIDIIEDLIMQEP